ncbi:hypothetical protein [Alkalibacillus almallahensis]|uniref:hypothetical protein n=1 Tax=Alkalibacillus almallahensis TaxID=1379154 RepID=UPI00141E4AAC|nr:hypothetical protein [Alkalibacillus almallahensis]NIK10995.1 uncharacterized protein YgfB (UPF0149 family) [Alkalibacillus almallahensis]
MVAKLYLNQNFKPSQQNSFVETQSQKEHKPTNQLKINRLLLLMQSVFQQLFALNEHAIQSDVKQDQLQQYMMQLINTTKHIDLKSNNYFNRLTHQIMHHDDKLDDLSSLTKQIIKEENQINNQLETLMAMQNEAINKINGVDLQLNKSSQLQIEMDEHIKEIEDLQRIFLDEQEQVNDTIKTYYNQVIEHMNKMIESNQTSQIYLLQKLNPGTPLTTVTVNGDSISVRLFVHMNHDTNLVTFVDAERQLLIADARDINAIQLKAVS